VLFSFSRDPTKLRALAGEVDGRAGTPAEAAALGEVVVLSVPWTGSTTSTDRRPPGQVFQYAHRFRPRRAAAEQLVKAS
jgi:hypothetical protein